MTDTYRILGLAGRGALEGEPGDHEPFLADIVIEADHEPDLTAVAAAAGGAIAPPARSLTERAERIAAAVHASGGPLAGVVVVLNRPEASLGVPVQAVEVTISRPGAQPRGVAPAGEAPGWGVPAPAAVAPTPPPAPVSPAPAAPVPVSPAPAPVREQAAPVAAQPAAAAPAAAVAPVAVPPAPPTPARQPPTPPAPPASQTSAETPAADWIPEPAPAAVPVPVWPRVSESAPAAPAPATSAAAPGAPEAWAPPAPPAPVAAIQEDEVFDGEALESEASDDRVDADEAFDDRIDDDLDDAVVADAHDVDETPLEAPPAEAETEEPSNEEASDEEPAPWLVVPPLEAPRIVDPVAPVVPAPVEGSLGVENDVDADLETEVENDDEAQPEAEDAAESDHPEDADLDVDALNQAHLGQVPIQTIATPVRRPSAAAPLPGLLVLSSTANDGKAQLTSVVAALRAASGIAITDVSPLARILTGGGNLYSAIVAITTTQAPGELAAICQDACAGQDAEAEILTIEGMVGEFDGVALPLPAAHQSAAVLAPWAQLQPAAVLPGLGGGPVAVLAQTAPDAGDVKWLALDWLE
ncbi:hypothetical protein [Salana multivorans]